MVLEGSVHHWLTPLLWACAKAAHHRGELVGVKNTYFKARMGKRGRKKASVP